MADSPSLLSACRTAVCASKVLSRTEGDGAAVDYRFAFWASTLGGARAIGLDDHLGNFAIGKQFDSVVVECNAGVYDSFPQAIIDSSSLPSDFEKFMNLGDDRNVCAVFVRGALVKGSIGRVPEGSELGDAWTFRKA